MLTISPISFPGLGLNIDPPASFSLGALTVNFYGICIATGLLLAVLYGSLRAKQFGFRQDDILDGVLWVVPFAILCARLYYCAFRWDIYKANPISILYIWEGGLAIYGGVIGAAVGIIVFCKIKKIRLGAMLDVVSIGFLIGQSIGRWGNFMNREAFGAATDSYFRMGLFNDKTQLWEYYHPTFLYESVWNAAGFLILASLCSKRKYDGQSALCYAAWYGLGRSIIEGLRVDSLWWGPFRVSQVLAAITCATAVAVLIWQNTKQHDPAKLYVNQLAEQKPAEKTEE